MSNHSRRDFLQAGSLGALAAVTTGSAHASTDSGAVHADLIVSGATVYTIDPDMPRAEAFAVKNGRFIAVGSNDDILNLASRTTRKIDARGMTVTPGFIDAHVHPAYAGARHIQRIDLRVTSIAAIQDLLRKKAADTPPGDWVLGFLYDDTKLTDGRALRRTDIDAAVPDHPVSVEHRGGHTAVYNSMAFSVAGITAATPNPPGGTFYKENGELTGRVAELARDPIESLIPEKLTREQRAEGVKLIGKLMSAAGITSVQETGGTRNELIALQDARAAGDLRLRSYLLCWGGDGDLYASLKAAGIRTGFGDEWIRIGGVKFHADGSASERTMAMISPYVGRPDDYGILVATQEQLNAAAEDASRNGFQIGIHANGDRAIDMVLTAYEHAQRIIPQADPRFRIEHCSLVNDALLKRMKAIGAIPTPFYTYLYYHGNKWAEYGAEKMRWMFAHRSFLDYGIPVAGASDYWAGPFEPLMAIQSMVTRRDSQGREWGPNQRVTVDEALHIGTLNGAHASYEEDIKGSITAGKLADFVILDDDPHRAEPDRIKDIGVVQTVVGGASTFEA